MHSLTQSHYKYPLSRHSVPGTRLGRAGGHTDEKETIFVSKSSLTRVATSEEKISPLFCIMIVVLSERDITERSSWAASLTTQNKNKTKKQTNKKTSQ